MQCPKIDEMSCGTVALTVPLINDVIQVGIHGPTDTTTIVVTRTPRTLIVHRQDWEPLRAQILHDEPPTHREVFGRSIRRLVVCRVGGEGSGLWRCDAPHACVHDHEVNQFVHTVASFARAKQLRGARV